MNQSDLLLVTLLVVMVGMMYLSGRRRKKQAQQMQDTLQVGSKVVLHSGVIGSVRKINAESVVIETAGSSLEVLRGAIRSINPVLTGVEAPVAAKAAAPKAAAKPAAKSPAKPAAKKPAAK